MSTYPFQNHGFQYAIRLYRFWQSDGAVLGMKSEKNFNFKAGIFTDELSFTDAAIEQLISSSVRNVAEMMLQG